MPDFSTQLSKYIPSTAAPIISQWINNTGCRFKVSRSRKSKLGDYTSPHQGKPHQITINHDLNPFAFLMTTIHEFAHLKTYQEFRNNVKPHGPEWKNNFRELIQPFLSLEIFPPDIVLAINKYMDNPAASSCTDLGLYRTLKTYDQKDDNIKHIEDIPPLGYFSMKNGRQFQKFEKLRKRYRCIELKTKKTYLFHPLAEVILIEDKD